MTMIIESKNHFLVGAAAHIVEDGRELAWAEKHVHKDQDLKWILGNFVEADNANDNGHIFPLADLRSAVKTIWNKPLNMLHHERYIVGAFAGAELLEPQGQAADATTMSSVVEALAAFWYSNFPEEFAVVEKAHKEGSLYYSMECIPRSLSCPAEGCDAQDRAYAGRSSDTYCDHMNALRGPKRLNNPHFNAGALIIPPIRPGWRNADITELSQLLREQAEDAERVYANLETELPHLGPKEWEAMMTEIIVLANDDIAAPVPSLRGHGQLVRLGAAGQISKDAVHYRDAGTGPDPDEATDPDDDDDTDPDRCGTCRNGVFVYNASGEIIGSMCDLVQGRIEEDDVCDLYSEVPEGVQTETWPSYTKDKDTMPGALEAKKFSEAKRKDLAKEGKAMPDGSFPIENEQDLKNAVSAIGRAKDPAKAKAHIKKRAKDLGKTQHIPDDWN